MANMKIGKEMLTGEQLMSFIKKKKLSVAFIKRGKTG